MRNTVDYSKHARRGSFSSCPDIFLLSEQEKKAYDFLFLAGGRLRTARSDLVGYHDVSFALFWISDCKRCIEQAELSLKNNTLF